jgi:hypothetical protein
VRRREVGVARGACLFGGVLCARPLHAFGQASHASSMTQTKNPRLT